MLRASPSDKSGYDVPVFGLSYFANKTIVHVLLTIALGAFIYSNTFNAPFYFDDVDNIVSNPAIRSLEYFKSPLESRIDLEGNLPYAMRTRFVGYLTFALNYSVHGLDVNGYHMVNILIHIINALLVYWLVTLLLRMPYLASGGGTYAGNERFFAFLCGIVFISHPIQTQAVTYVVQRLSSLMTMFYLVSFVMYVKARLSKPLGKGLAFYVLSLSAAVLAMLTKENAVTLPFVVLLCEVMFNRDGIKKRALYLGPFVLTLLIIPVALAAGTGWSYGSIIKSALAITSSEDISSWGYFLTESRVLVTYLRLFFLPRREERLVSFGFLWFFVTLSVESSVIPIADVIFEHRMYLPSVGAIIAIVASMVILTDSYGWKRAKKASVPVLAGVIALFSIMAYSRNSIWQEGQDGIMLWADVVSKSPGKARPHFSLGEAYYEKGMHEKAMEELRKAMILKPDYTGKHDMKGVQRVLGQYVSAVSKYEAAQRDNPDSAEAHSNLGAVYEALGRYEDAEKEYEDALRVDPGYARAHNNLGVIHDRHGRYEDAIREYRSALSIVPDYSKAHNNLGVVYKRLDRYEDAIGEFRAALKSEPGYANAHKNLGATYEKLGRYEDAVKEYQEALNIQPENMEFRDRLSRAYEKMMADRP
jgi:tetratricopeptide (TPR) repeat protein